MTQRTALVLAAIALAGAPAVASARVPSEQTILAAAVDDATAYWDAQPCGGQVTFQPVSNGPSSWSMWSTWDSPAGPAVEGPQADAAAFTNCTVSINTRAWLSPATEYYDWDEFCYGVAHEWEHLLNKWWLETPFDHGTATEPLTSVAYARFTDLNTPPTCSRHPWRAPY